MENKVILPFSSMLTAVSNIANTMKAPVEWLRGYYSHCLDKEINMHQTWLLIRTQVAFLLAAFSICSLSLRVVFALLFLAFLLQCKREI